MTEAPSARIKSMTGYGRGSAEAEGVRVEVEIRGVNHRFLDLKMKLPPELGALEPEMRAQVQRSVGRARLDIGFVVVTTRQAACRVDVNRALIEAYLSSVAAVKKEFRLRGPITLESVLSLPGAVAVRTGGEAFDGIVPRVAALALQDGLRGYDAMRAEEGARLAEALRAHLRVIAGEVRTIEGEARGIPEAYAKRLRERIEILVKDRGFDDLRLAQEVALLADRVDITEELVRLKGHVDQAEAALAHPEGPVGKTLDFIMQEMSRETNTISSKAELLSIGQAALRIKSEVEKIREQVQNLE